MPFNINDVQGNQTESGKPQPILHTPNNEKSHSKKSLIIVVAIVLVLAAVFAIYKSGVFKSKPKPTNDVAEVSMMPVDTAGPPPHYDTAAVEPPEKVVEKKETPPPSKKKSEAETKKKTETTPPVNKKTETPPTKPVPPPPAKQKAEPVPTKSVTPPPTGGGYAIYTGSFKLKAHAEHEVDRLTKAGLQAWMSESDGLFHTAVGKYPHRAPAQADADKWKDSFPNGFHVARIK